MVLDIRFERPMKRSLNVNGHKTSVTLETAFWQAFVAMAKARKLTLNDFANHIDQKRKVDCSLASAIRLYVLAHYQNLAKSDNA